MRILLGRLHIAHFSLLRPLTNVCGFGCSRVRDPDSPARSVLISRFDVSISLRNGVVSFRFIAPVLADDVSLIGEGAVGPRHGASQPPRSVQSAAVCSPMNATQLLEFCPG